MPFPKLTIITTDGQRDICVIDNQPYYCSSGFNSEMPDVWLPFEGFELPMLGIPLYSKPDATNDPDNINANFPAATASALQNWASELPGGIEHSERYWGRFKDIKSLYTSCLLTIPPNNIPIEIRSAAAQDIGLAPERLQPNNFFKLEEHSQSTIRLSTAVTQDDVNQLNMILAGMGYQAPNLLARETPALQVYQAYIDASQAEVQTPIEPISPEIIALGEAITTRHSGPSGRIDPPLSAVTIAPGSAKSSSNTCCEWLCGKKEQDQDSHDKDASDPESGNSHYNPMTIKR